MTSLHGKPFAHCRFRCSADFLTDQGLHQPGARMAFRLDLSTPFSLVLVSCRPLRLRLHADELEAEIAQPVEESVKL